MTLDPNWVVSGQHREEMQRALTVSSAGTVLLQQTVNRIVASLTLRHHGVMEGLDHRTGTGDAALVNRRTARNPAGQWVADTDAPGVVASTYARASFTYRTYVSRGRVTRKLQATGRAYTDILSMELAMTVEDHADGLEYAYVVGNNAANANQPNGLLTLLNGVSGQVIANTTTNAGGPLLLSKLDEAIDLVKGANADKMIFVSQKGARLLNAALQAQQQFNDRTEIEAGFRVRTYDDIPIMKSTNIPDDMDWDGTNVTILDLTGESSEPTTAAIIVNRNQVWIEELTPTSVLPLAKGTSQYDEFDVFTDSVVVLHATNGGALLAGLN